MAVVMSLNVNCMKYLRNLFMLGNIGLNSLVNKHFGQLDYNQT